MHKGEILQKYNTSLGLVSIIGFDIKIEPFIGMVIKNTGGLRWEVTGIGANRKHTVTDLQNTEKYESVWDFVITPIGHDQAISVMDLVEIVDDISGQK